MGSGGGIGWRIMHCGVWQHIGVVGNLRLAEVADKFTDLEKREVRLWGKLTHLDSRRGVDKLAHLLLREGMGSLVPDADTGLMKLEGEGKFMVGLLAFRVSRSTGDLVAGGSEAWCGKDKE